MPKQDGPRISPAEYRDFLSQLDLEDIELIKGTIERNRTPGPDAKLTYKQRVTKVEYLLVDGGFQATLHYLVKFGEEGVKEPFGLIRVAFSATYASDKPMTDEIFDVFSELNLTTNVYPFVREFVNSATSRMGLPGLVLPMLKPWS